MSIEKGCYKQAATEIGQCIQRIVGFARSIALLRNNVWTTQLLSHVSCSELAKTGRELLPTDILFLHYYFKGFRPFALAKSHTLQSLKETSLDQNKTTLPFLKNPLYTPEEGNLLYLGLLSKDEMAREIRDDGAS